MTSRLGQKDNIEEQFPAKPLDYVIPLMSTKCHEWLTESERLMSVAYTIFYFFCVGRYVYIEVSPQRPKESARLVSPVISVSSASTKCLTFWYHMYGPHVGSLNVYANATTLGSPIWSKNGTQGNQWKQAIDLEIQMSQSYSVSLLPNYSLAF